MTTRPLYQHIASRMTGVENCRKSANHEWLAKHLASINALVERYLPSGSGIDNGTTFDDKMSTSEKLVFHMSFHHMDGSGMYSGWTEHSVIVRPSLAFGIAMRVTGLNHNEIKEYLHEVYQHALTESVQDEIEPVARAVAEAG